MIKSQSNVNTKRLISLSKNDIGSKEFLCKIKNNAEKLRDPSHLNFKY